MTSLERWLTTGLIADDATEYDHNLRFVAVSCMGYFNPSIEA